jgi:hypothetical protein
MEGIKIETLVTELKICSISSTWLAKQELDVAALCHPESGFREPV